MLRGSSKLACIEFHKKVVTPNPVSSLLCRLPRDILEIIYNYIFPNGIIRYEIKNHNTNFPYPNKNDFKKLSLFDVVDKKVKDLTLTKKAHIYNDVKNIVVNDILPSRAYHGGLFGIRGLNTAHHLKNASVSNNANKSMTYCNLL